MVLENLQQEINKNLYKGDHIFNFIHHFAFELEESSQDNFGAYVKTSNGEFSYREFWE